MAVLDGKKRNVEGKLVGGDIWGVLMGLCVWGLSVRGRAVGMIDGRRVVSADMYKRCQQECTSEELKR